MNRTLVIKLGGGAISEIHTIAEDVHALNQRGERVVIVHGGGAQTSALQRAVGDEPKKVAGRRVTDERALEALKMAVGGKVNIEICAALMAAGASAVGLNGTSGGLITATRRPPRVIHGAGEEPIDLGLVGDIESINVQLLSTLLDTKHTPVIACIGAGRDGALYNINADVVAAKIASECGADALVLVSDITGVLQDPSNPNSRIASIDREEHRKLVDGGIITGGMIPKLDEAFSVLGQGVSEVHIVGQLQPGQLMQAMREPGTVGTVLVSDHDHTP